MVWDSTSLGLLKECARKYYFTMILQRSTLSNAHLEFGLFYAKILEHYDILKATNRFQHDELVHEVTKYALLLTWGWESTDKYKNRYNLLRTVIWYMEEFKDDHLRTHLRADGRAAAELSFKFQIDIASPTGEDYWLAGHLDRPAWAGDDLYITDRKTTGGNLGEEYFLRFEVDHQMSHYTLAGQVIFDQPVAGVIIDAAQVKIDFSRFQRGLAPRSKARIAEWRHDLAILFKQNESYVDRNYWPMNDKACFLCGYKKVCRADPNMREAYLSTFTHRVWDPTINRGV